MAERSPSNAHSDMGLVGQTLPRTHPGSLLRDQLRRHPGAVTVAGSLVVCGALVVALSGTRDEFAAALRLAPVWILAAAVLLHLVWLVARSEAWHVCVGAAGGEVSRRRLYRAASIGYLGNLFNGQFGLAVRIARAAPLRAPREPVPLCPGRCRAPNRRRRGHPRRSDLVHAGGAAGVPWWVPLVCFAFTAALMAGLTRARPRPPRRVLEGLRGHAGARGRSRIIGLIVFAVCAQIARNWLVLQGIGVDASVLDSTALLIGVAVIGLLPVGPSVGAAAAVVILGANGVAATAAAGALLTATAALGALCFAAWALVDRLRPSAAPLPAPVPL